MNIKGMDFEDIRQHAISATTLASVVMSQVDEVATYAPVAAAIAFLFAATGYRTILKAADDIVDALEDANIIDEEMAEGIETVLDKVEEIIED